MVLIDYVFVSGSLGTISEYPNQKCKLKCSSLDCLGLNAVQSVFLNIFPPFVVQLKWFKVISFVHKKKDTFLTFVQRMTICNCYV